MSTFRLSFQINMVHTTQYSKSTLVTFRQNFPSSPHWYRSASFSIYPALGRVYKSCTAYSTTRATLINETSCFYFSVAVIHAAEKNSIHTRIHLQNFQLFSFSFLRRPILFTSPFAYCRGKNYRVTFARGAYYTVNHSSFVFSFSLTHSLSSYQKQGNLKTCY